MPDELSEVERRSVFAALVGVQDEGKPVAISRSLIADQYGLPIEQIVAIEHEGLRHQWAPL